MARKKIENDEQSCKEYVKELACGCDAPNVKKGEVKQTQQDGPYTFTSTFTALHCLNCRTTKDIGPASGGASYFPGSGAAHMRTVR